MVMKVPGWLILEIRKRYSVINLRIGIYFLALIFGTTAYIAGSLLTYRRPFNLERLLHRGKYNTDGVDSIKSPWT